MTTLQLPAGSQKSIELLCMLERKVLARLSKRILDVIHLSNAQSPLSVDEKAQLMSVMNVQSSAEVSLMISVASELWRQIAYHQMKRADLTEELAAVGFSENSAQILADVWEELGADVSSRLRSLSRSGVPELKDVNWTLQLERASRFEGPKREPAVQVQLVTDQGNKYTKLDFDQLKTLHYTLQTIRGAMGKSRKESGKSKECAKCKRGTVLKKVDKNLSKVEVTKVDQGQATIKGDWKAVSLRVHEVTWVDCDGCGSSFHGSCADVQEYEYELMEKYRCADCVPTLGETTWRALVAPHRHHDDQEEEKDKPVQVGSRKWIKDFMKTESDTPPATDDILETFADGAAFMENFDRTKEWDKPMLIKDAAGLGLVLPANFNINRCVQLVGKDTTILTMDVYAQTNYQMKMQRFAEMWKTPAAKRTRLYNTLSLEFSHYKLADLVQAPDLVRELSWADRFWTPLTSATYSVPDWLLQLTSGQYQNQYVLDHLMAKPNVEMFCLLSMGGSFTDCHVDFGGSTVWYHVYKGKKIFYVAEPTDENLKVYEAHDAADDKTERYMDTLLSDGLRRIVIEEGGTLMMPSGWIHSVYTPVDSIVFGGNFLHDLNIAMQFKINEIEIRRNFAYEYVYPSFEVINWYAAQHLSKRLKEVDDDEKPVLLEGAKVLLKYLRARMNVYKRRKGKHEAVKFGPTLVELINAVESQETSVPAQGSSGKGKRTASLSSNKCLALEKKPRLTLQKQPSSSAVKQLAAAGTVKIDHRA
ncbi:Jmjc domain protein [Aphelenchoides avenae]|nr:Jmjc domain protein [Aphelenchus avenae]